MTHFFPCALMLVLHTFFVGATEMNKIYLNMEGKLNVFNKPCYAISASDWI